MFLRAVIGAVSGAIAGLFLVLALPDPRPALDEDEYVYVLFGHLPMWMLLSACIFFWLLKAVKADNRWLAALGGVPLWLVIGIGLARFDVWHETSPWLPTAAFLVPTTALALAGVLTTPRRKVG